MGPRPQAQGPGSRARALAPRCLALGSGPHAPGSSKARHVHNCAPGAPRGLVPGRVRGPEGTQGSPRGGARWMQPAPPLLVVSVGGRETGPRGPPRRPPKDPQGPGRGPGASGDLPRHPQGILRDPPEDPQPPPSGGSGAPRRPRVAQRRGAHGCNQRPSFWLRPSGRGAGRILAPRLRPLRALEGPPATSTANQAKFSRSRSPWRLTPGARTGRG